MPNRLLLILIYISCCIGCSFQKEPPSPPNIILILADDLGYGDLGCYGQKIIETPNIDQLAETGMRFTQHYTAAPVCAPARYMLLTGKHSGHAYIRGNDEWASRGAVWNYDSMFLDPYLEGQRPLPESEVTLASVLKQKGYKTGIVGKWGLGGPMTNSTPNDKGFDFFYGYNCQRQAHTYYPLHLWKNKDKVLLNNENVAPRTPLEEDADRNDPNSYNKYTLSEYTPDLMQQEVLTFLEQNTDEPFFLYYATPVPHLPLQADNSWLKYYQRKIGQEDPYIGDRGYFPHQTPKAAYAAMISHLDEQVGEIVQKLKDLGLYENSLIIFTSDNGATYTGGADTQFFVSNGAFGAEYGRGKGFVYEGGIRVPMIASWPGYIQSNTTNNHPSVFYDYLATFCDLTGVEAPSNDGISFLNALLGEENMEHEYLYWEFPEYNGQVAIRKDNLKFIWRDLKGEESAMELYDLSVDPYERNNIMANNQEKIDDFQSIIINEHQTPEIERFQISRIEEMVSKSYQQINQAGF